MSAAGLLTELIAKAAGLVPATRSAVIAPEHLSWNYTTILNIVFLIVAAGIYWLHRSRERFGGGVNVARDPVCGMQVDMGNPGAVLQEDGHTTYFCSGHCRDRFTGRGGGASTARIRDRPLRDRDHNGGTARFPQPSQRHAEHAEPDPPRHAARSHPAGRRRRPHDRAASFSAGACSSRDARPARRVAQPARPTGP